jgi:hypothetical protein
MQLRAAAGNRPPGAGGGTMYLPPEQVRHEDLAATQASSMGTREGAARYCTMRAGGQVTTKAAWCHPHPGPPAPDQNHVRPGTHCGCLVETLGEGQLQDVLTMAAAEGVSVTPAPVPDTRVTISVTPRCNRILGNGAWDIPPDDPSMARLFVGPA